MVCVCVRVPRPRAPCAPWHVRCTRAEPCYMRWPCSHSLARYLRGSAGHLRAFVALWIRASHCSGGSTTRSPQRPGRLRASARARLRTNPFGDSSGPLCMARSMADILLGPSGIVMVQNRAHDVVRITKPHLLRQSLGGPAAANAFRLLIVATRQSSRQPPSSEMACSKARGGTTLLYLSHVEVWGLPRGTMYSLLSLRAQLVFSVASNKFIIAVAPFPGVETEKVADIRGDR